MVSCSPNSSIMKWIFRSFSLVTFVLILSSCGNQETNKGLPIPAPPAETTTPQVNSDSATQNQPLGDTTTLPDSAATH